MNAAFKQSIFISCYFFAVCQVSAVEVIPEQELSEHVGSSGSINTQQLQHALAENNIKTEEKDLVEKNNQIIQEKSLDGTAMTEFYNQQKKIDEKLIPPPTSTQLLRTQKFVIQEVDNIKVTYPDAITIELKR